MMKTDIRDFKAAIRKLMLPRLILVSLIILETALSAMLMYKFANSIERFLKAHFSSNIEEMLRGASLFGPAVIIMFIMIFICDRLAKRDACLYCPYCKKELLHKAGEVIATSNCPYCHEHIIECSGEN